MISCYINFRYLSIYLWVEKPEGQMLILGIDNVSLRKLRELEGKVFLELSQCSGKGIGLFYDETNEHSCYTNKSPAL